jgi:NAD(P)-dependent dehydrogenase (short-subunit alcohol dehydrogenase family)
VRVNAVSPGPVATDLWLGEHGVAETVATATGVDADTAREQVIAGHGGFATGRFTTPEEVAALITMLASPRLGNVTGANYVIDGGLIKTVFGPPPSPERAPAWRPSSPAGRAPRPSGCRARH